MVPYPPTATPGPDGALEAAAAPGTPGDAGGVVGLGGAAEGDALPVPATVGEAGTGSVGGAADGGEPGRAACFAIRAGGAAEWCAATAEAPPTLLSG